MFRKLPYRSFDGVCQTMGFLHELVHAAKKADALVLLGGSLSVSGSLSGTLLPFFILGFRV